jgi:hypothetical protein
MVSSVAADSYTDNTGKLMSVDKDIFKAYTKIISEHKTAKTAAAYMCDFYKTFLRPDILQINDAVSSYFKVLYDLTGRIHRKGI